MRKAFFQSLLLFFLLALPIAVLVLRSLRSGADSAVGSPDNPATVEKIDPRSGAVEFREPSAAEPLTEPSPREAVFLEWEEWLVDDGGRLGPRHRLSRWRETLGALPREDALESLRAYWQSGRDARLGLPFASGPDGALETAPTVRTAVLDLLGRWDPSGAYRLAAERLGEVGGSADEYALHLRNYAWGAPDTAAADHLRGYLTDRTLALINHEPWQNHPSEGYQEAFDVLVWAGAVDAVPTLVEIMATDDQPERTRPAGLTLDRLVLAAPYQVLATLRDDQRVGDRFPHAATGFWARADPADPAQRALLQDWFLDPEQTEEERLYLLSLVPNLNLRLSHNLLSENQVFTREEILRRHHAVRAMFTEWTRDPAFAPWKDAVDRSMNRLEEALAGTEPIH